MHDDDGTIEMRSGSRAERVPPRGTAAGDRGGAPRRRYRPAVVIGLGGVLAAGGGALLAGALDGTAFSPAGIHAFFTDSGGAPSAAPAVPSLSKSLAARSPRGLSSGAFPGGGNLSLSGSASPSGGTATGSGTAGGASVAGGGTVRATTPTTGTPALPQAAGTSSSPNVPSSPTATPSLPGVPSLPGIPGIPALTVPPVAALPPGGSGGTCITTPPVPGGSSSPFTVSGSLSLTTGSGGVSLSGGSGGAEVCAG